MKSQLFLHSAESSPCSIEGEGIIILCSTMSLIFDVVIYIRKLKSITNIKQYLRATIINFVGTNFSDFGNSALSGYSF